MRHSPKRNDGRGLVHDYRTDNRSDEGHQLSDSPDEGGCRRQPAFTGNKRKSGRERGSVRSGECVGDEHSHKQQRSIGDRSTPDVECNEETPAVDSVRKNARCGTEDRPRPQANESRHCETLDSHAQIKQQCDGADPEHAVTDA